MIAARSLFAPLLATSLVFGCKVSIPKNKTHRAADTAASVSPTAVAPASTSQPTAPPTAAQPAPALPLEDQVFRVPLGPAFTILPGEGIGPIRFGAKLATIQRLMEAECTEVVQRDGLQWCRYQAHAVEFGLEDGALVTIHIHGTEREFVAGKGLSVENNYGIFHGKFANQAQLGMYRQYAAQGEPSRIEEVTPGRYPTVEKHYYDDMVLEFDKLRNGNTVLGGVLLTKPTGKAKPKSKKPRPSTPRAKPKPKAPVH